MYFFFFVFRFQFTVLLSFGLSFDLHAIRFHSRLQCVVALYANNGDVSADSNSFSWIPSVYVAVSFYLSSLQVSLSRNSLRLLWLALVWFGTKARKFSYTQSVATVLNLSLSLPHTHETNERMNKRTIRFSFATNRMQNYAWLAVGIRCSY